MPQNTDLCEEWKTDLGDKCKEIQKTYLRTLGNLTLTGYNSELSDSPFKTKRDMEGGFRDSPIRLNRYLANLEKMNEQEIINRAEEITNLAITVWAYPFVDSDVLSKYKSKESESAQHNYTIEYYPQLKQGESMRLLFEELRVKILNIDSSVTEEPTKLYIAYKSVTNFVDIVPQKKALRLSLNIPFEKIKDPRAMCRDVSGLGKWGNGDTEVKLTSREELDYVIGLIKQAFDNIMGSENDN
jgi:predicted transport protein